MYRLGQRWMGLICCFLLFVLVYLSLHLSVPGRFITTGHIELGLLLFILPGAIASFFSRDDLVVGPLMGAMLALPLCMLIVNTVFTPTRSLWQEVAWLCSAVFWSSLGSLSFLAIDTLRHRCNGNKKPT